MSHLTAENFESVDQFECGFEDDTAVVDNHKSRRARRCSSNVNYFQMMPYFDPQLFVCRGTIMAAASCVDSEC